MSSFAPQPAFQADEPGSAATVAGAAPQAPPEVYDINDPQLSSEPTGINLQGDAYAVPPPPPDQKWWVKLKIAQQEDPAKAGVKVDYLIKKHDRQGLYLASAIEATIIDGSGKFDGIKVYDYWVSMFKGRDGSTKISTILSKLRKPDGTPWLPPESVRWNQRTIMDTFVKALAGEPEVGIETNWEWNCQVCGEIADKKGEKRPRGITGMQRFPIDQDKSKVAGATVYSPEMRCSVNAAHMYSRAQVRIARFLSQAEYQKHA